MTTFIISAHNRDNAKAQIDKLDPTRLWVMQIDERKSKLTNEQIRWTRGFATDFGKHFGYDPDFAYDMLMLKCNPVFFIDPQTGEETRMPGHLTKKQDGTPRNTAETAEIQDYIQRYASEVGFVWSDE